MRGFSFELGGGWTHMARDRVLLHLAEAGRAGWRIYRWDGPWVTLGRNQRPEEALIPRCRVPWVLRPTGGQAVLHGHDLTLAIAVPLEPGRERRVKEVYRSLVQPIADALTVAGAPTRLGEDFGAGKATRAADCFAAPAGNDLVDVRTGFKVGGCALRILRRAALLQVSLPLGVPLVDPREVYFEPAVVRPLAIDVGDFALSLSLRWADLY